MIEVKNAENDTCKWRLYHSGTYGSIFNYNLGCNGSTLQQTYPTEYRFCPYCGKEIEVTK